MLALASHARFSAPHFPHFQRTLYSTAESIGGSPTREPSADRTMRPPTESDRATRERERESGAVR
jgi:hypothetical protein